MFLKSAETRAFRQHILKMLKLGHIQINDELKK